MPRDEAIAIAERFLDKVGLSDKRDEYPARLSGGQKQRVAIARALTMEPKVLLFDEPTSALDPTLVGEVLNVMEELAHEGATMIVVTHEMAFAREAADRVYFIEEGISSRSGRREQVIERPRTSGRGRSWRGCSRSSERGWAGAGAVRGLCQISSPHDQWQPSARSAHSWPDYFTGGHWGQARDPKTAVHGLYLASAARPWAPPERLLRLGVANSIPAGGNLANWNTAEIGQALDAFRGQNSGHRNWPDSRFGP